MVAVLTCFPSQVLLERPSLPLFLIAHTHMHAHPCTPMHTHAHACTCMGTRAQAHMCTCTHNTRVHTCMGTMHTCTRTCTGTHKHTHRHNAYTCAHTCMGTHAHVHMHTYIHTGTMCVHACTHTHAHAPRPQCSPSHWLHPSQPWLCSRRRRKIYRGSCSAPASQTQAHPTRSFFIWGC